MIGVDHASSAAGRYAAAADELLRAGRLEGIVTHRVVRSRDARDETHEELLLLGADPRAGLALPLGGRAGDGTTTAVAARIARAHRTWLKTVGRRGADAPLFETLAEAVGTTPSARIEAVGHAIGSNREHGGPSPTAWIQVRGPDTRTCLRRLELRRYALHEIDGLLASHVRAEEVARRWAEIGAVAEITTNAAALAEWIGVTIDDVVSGLARSPKLRIRGRSADDRPTVTFGWSGFAITAETDRRRPAGMEPEEDDWRLKGYSLDLPGINPPDASLVELVGRPFEMLAAAGMLDGSTRIKEASLVATGGVSLVLERRTVPVTLIGNSLVVGRAGDAEPPAADR